MPFIDWNELMPASDLLLKTEWRSFERIISALKDAATSESVSLIFLLVPTKLQVYGSLASDRSNDGFKQNLTKQLVFENNFSEAFEIVAGRLGLDYINLLPIFKDLAPDCLLYSPFDTHWNVNGRRVAAAVVADWISSNDRASSEKFDLLRFQRKACVPK